MVALTELGSIDELDVLLPPAQPEKLAEADVTRLALSYFSLPADLAPLPRVDPFSPLYAEAVRHLLNRITGRPSPPNDVFIRPAPSRAASAGPGWQPAMYAGGDSRVLGDLLMSVGALLKALDVRRGARILEYGGSDGQLAIALARMGCAVTVVDPDGRNLALIDHQARALGLTIELLQAPLGHAPAGAQYDRILLIEALHHAVGHFAILPTLQRLLAPSGQILFGGEPVLDDSSPWLDAVPYPWGPRLDALSLRTMRHLGCAEIAFRRTYFIEMLLRGGMIPHEAGPHGEAYLAAPRPDRVAFGAPFLLDALPGWGPPDGTLRWTIARCAILPIDQLTAATQICLRVCNPTPDPRHLRLDAGLTPIETTVGPYEERELLVAIPHHPGRITLDATASPDATRPVGIAVEWLEYQAPRGA